MNKGFKESENLSSEQCVDNQFETVKEEILEEIYKSELENIPENEFDTSNVDLIINNEKILDESKNLNLKEHFDEKVFIKGELLDEEEHKLLLRKGELLDNKEYKLLLHKEEILDDVHIEELKNQPKKILEYDQCDFQETSENKGPENRDKKPFTKEKSCVPNGSALKKHSLNPLKNKKYSHSLFKICVKEQILGETEKKLDTSKVDLIDYEKLLDESKNFILKQHFNENVRRELLDEIHLQSRGNPTLLTQHSDEEYKLLLHKEEVLDDVHIEELKDQPKKILEYNQCDPQGTTSTSKEHALTPLKNKYYCSLCPKSYTQKNVLNNHMITHANVQFYSCSVCMKNFSAKFRFNHHMLIHTNKRRYFCSICMKGFYYKYQLNEHVILHSNKAPYTCSICTKSFALKGSLNKHILGHSKKRSFFCSVCMKGFVLKSYLIQHTKRIHSNERPYSCSACMKSFAHKHALKRHMSIHSKRPHSCSICMESFVREENLVEHMAIHSDNKPYS